MAVAFESNTNFPCESTCTWAPLTQSDWHATGAPDLAIMPAGSPLPNVTSDHSEQDIVPAPSTITTAPARYAQTPITSAEVNITGVGDTEFRIPNRQKGQERHMDVCQVRRRHRQVLRRDKTHPHQDRNLLASWRRTAIYNGKAR